MDQATDTVSASDASSIEKKTPTALQYVSSRLQYSLEETDGRALQIIVHPATTISIDKKSLCWASNDLEIVPRSSFFQEFMGSPAASIVDVHNPTSGPLMCCASKAGGDRVCELKLESKVAERGLFVYHGSFLCCTSEVKLVHNRPYQLTAAANAWAAPRQASIFNCCFVEGIKGMLFLQSEGAVLRKELAATERLQIDSLLLVAHTQGCKIASSDSRSGFYCIRGPGTVFISAQTARSRVFRSSPLAGGGARGPLLLRMVIFFFVSMLLSLGWMLVVQTMFDGEFAEAVKELVDEFQRG